VCPPLCLKQFKTKTLAEHPPYPSIPTSCCVPPISDPRHFRPILFQRFLRPPGSGGSPQGRPHLRRDRVPPSPFPLVLRSRGQRRRRWRGRNGAVAVPRGAAADGVRQRRDSDHQPVGAPAGIGHGDEQHSCRRAIVPACLRPPASPPLWT